MFKRIKSWPFLAVCAIAAQSSCSKMNDLHDQYFQNGEQIYLGRLSMADLKPGKERVLLRYVNKDPKVEKLLVYWEAGRDSIFLDVPADALNDTVSVYIDNLQEDNYNFELYTANEDLSYKSMKYEVSGNVYGDRFQASLRERSTTDKKFYSALNHLIIDWTRAPQYAVGTELTYVNADGDQVIKQIRLAEFTTELHDVSSDINVRTLFLPSADAVDTFYTDHAPLEPITIEGLNLDKGKFNRWNPVGIPYSGPWEEWRIELAWDNSLAGGFANENRDFTFEIGQLARLTQFVLHARSEPTLIYNHAHMQRFQVWGSATPDVTADFSGWTLLGSFESVKPSGQPRGVVTAADVENAHVNGEEYVFDKDLPPVRYIRIVAQDTWGNEPGIQFMEFSFMGVAPE